MSTGSSTASVASRRTCGSRSRRSARCAARTACRRRGCPRSRATTCSSAPEIARLVGIAARDLGVREVRFTGGEPLTRGDLVEIVRLSAEAAPGIPMSMTTNGIGLDKRAGARGGADSTRINVSLDTVDREHFARLTRRDRLPAVLAGHRGCRRARGSGRSRSTPCSCARPSTTRRRCSRGRSTHGLRLRFIEQMPLDADAAWRRDNMVPAAELLDGARRALRADAGRPRRPVGARRGVARWMADPPRSGSSPR